MTANTEGFLCVSELLAGRGYRDFLYASVASVRSSISALLPSTPSGECLLGRSAPVDHVTPFIIVLAFGIGVALYGTIHVLWPFPKMGSVITGLCQTSGLA